MLHAAASMRHSRTACAGLFRLACVLIVFGLLATARSLAGPQELWLLVDTGELTLSVMRGEAVVKRYDNIAIGSNGPTRNKRVADEKTPLGDFRIIEVKLDSRFHRFLAIDYPNRLDIGSALIDGRISLQEYDALQGALDKGEQPSQETAIGGYLGIHGLGTGDLEVHGAFNWTNGCIAMTNEEVDELAESISIGTRISIR